MKIELILLLYDELIREKTVLHKEICVKHKVSERTVYRYVHVITVFFRIYELTYFGKNVQMDILKNNAKK